MDEWPAEAGPEWPCVILYAHEDGTLEAEVHHAYVPTQLACLRCEMVPQHVHIRVGHSRRCVRCGELLD